jgi:hypothetical protein
LRDEKDDIKIERANQKSGLIQGQFLTIAVMTFDLDLIPFSYKTHTKYRILT